MKKLQIAKIQFNKEIQGSEIKHFRGAVINKLNKDNILFHNHEGNKFRYKYPLIQYKRINKKASLICIDSGVNEVQELFALKDWEIKIGEEKKSLAVENLNLNQFNMQVWNHYFDYNLFNWMALNQKNYEKYKYIKTENEKYLFLENILRGNILSMCKGIGLDVDKEIKVHLNDIANEKVITYKDVKHQTFDVSFKTNIFLPEYIGLGKGVSIGFGTVKTRKE